MKTPFTMLAVLLLAPLPGYAQGSAQQAQQAAAAGRAAQLAIEANSPKLAVTEDEMYLNFMQPGEALEDYKDAESIELHPGDKLTKDLKRKYGIRVLPEQRGRAGSRKASSIRRGVCRRRPGSPPSPGR